ncbi:hypothetical protein G3I59_46635 [Amycolatopsis rubida]|uniref:Uncharacterized protein n=1 Tax=Amycolatopsis rubida TaxID=112413 RepID=A0ABX0CD40_9PSEU|nr:MULTISPECIES: hypothetical protein [Amycolatopsis]MYW97892.1 hypothetical protein [Amycolatopsis rubida]NEC62878.1 hypothetical protein [Amycolatopsis rubida]
MSALDLPWSSGNSHDSKCSSDGRAFVVADDGCGADESDDAHDDAAGSEPDRAFGVVDVAARDVAGPEPAVAVLDDDHLRAVGGRSAHSVPEPRGRGLALLRQPIERGCASQPRAFSPSCFAPSARYSAA